MNDVANSTLFSERGWFSSEISARSVIPSDWGKEYICGNNSDLRILMGIADKDVGKLINNIFLSNDVDSTLNARNTFDDPPRLELICEMSDVVAEDGYELHTREWPLWTCFTEIESGLTVAEISCQAAERIKKEFKEFQPSTFTAVSRKAFKTVKRSAILGHRNGYIK